MAEASVHALVGSWTGGWREATGQHGIRGIVRGDGDAGFACLQRGAKIRGYWFDSLKNVYARDAATCTLELTAEEGGATITGVATDKNGAESTWTLRRAVVQRDEGGKLAAFTFKNAAVFERLTKLPAVETDALHTEALSASLREIASATATGLRGAVSAPGNANGDITYIPPVSLFTPYDGKLAVRSARTSRHGGKQLLTSTTRALTLTQRIADAPEWIPPEDRPRSRSRGGNNTGSGRGGGDARSPSQGAPASPSAGRPVSAAPRGGDDTAAADAEVAAATGGAAGGGGGARPTTAAGGSAEADARPPFRPVSSLHFTAAEDSRETAFLGVVTADTAPEELAKLAKAQREATTGKARALASPHLVRGAEGRFDVKLAPSNFLLSGQRPGPSSRAAGEYMPGDSYDVEERMRRGAMIRGPVALQPPRRPGSSASGAPPTPAAEAEPARPFRTCGPPPPTPAGPFITASALDFGETLAGRVSAARAQSAAPGSRGRRPGTAASAASGGGAPKPDPLAERPTYNPNSKDLARYTLKDPSLYPPYICAVPSDPRQARPGSPERKSLLETLKTARVTSASGGGQRWREVITPGVRPLATPGVMTLPANVFKLRPKTAAASSSGSPSNPHHSFAYSATSPRKMSMALAVIHGVSHKSTAISRPSP